MPDSESLTTDRDAAGRLQPQFVNLIRKNWLLIGIAGLVGSVAAGFYSVGQTRVFRASTTLQIEPTPPRPLGAEVQGAVEVGSGMLWNTQEYYRTQHEILKSRAVALQTVKRLGLHRDPSFLLNEPSGVAAPPGFEPNEDQAQAALQSRLRIVPVKDSRLVTVTFDDAEPERGKRVLSTLVEIYIDQNVDSALESTNAAAEWLNVQVAKLKEELGGRELALHDYKKDNQILSVSMDDQNNMLRDEMQQLNQELTRVRASIEEVSARYKQLVEIDVEDPTRLPVQELLDSQLLQRLRADFIEAKKDYAALIESGKGENHPSTLAAASKVEVSKSGLLSEVTNIRDALGRRLAAKRSEAAGLSGLFERAKTQALELNRLGLEYTRLDRAKKNTEKVYSLVLERSKESDLTRYLRFNNIRVIDHAITAERPVSPKTSQNVALGAFAGLCLGFLGALGKVALDRTFRGAREVEESLGATVLGSLPRTAAKDRAAPKESEKKRRGRNAPNGNELIVHEKPMSSAAEAARALRTNLMFASPDRAQRTLLVTSGGPSDGKTTVACWVATALAQAGKRILLLDCDLRRPRLHKVFGRTAERGLSTLLLDNSLLGTWDLSTEVPNLDLLTAGPGVPNAAELLQSERFDSLMQKLLERYDQIVIDSPPVMAVTDATILSTKVDGTLLVIRANFTPRDLAKQTVRTLRDVTKNLLGVAINDLDNRRGGSAYGGYYRYEYYARSEDKEA